MNTRQKLKREKIETEAREERRKIIMAMTHDEQIERLRKIMKKYSTPEGRARAMWRAELI